VTSEIQRGSLLMAFGATIITAALLYAGTGLHPAWWAMWIAPLPIVLVAPRLSWFGAFGAAALAWYIGELNLWRYFHGVLEIPAALVLGILVLPACLFGAGVLMFRVRIRRGAIWQAALVLPAFWVTSEYVSALVSPHSTFGNIAYTQMNFLPVVQMASLTGIWGISFCVVLFPAAVAAFFSGRGSRGERNAMAIAAIAFLAAVLGYGAWRLRATPRAKQNASILLMASDEREFIFPHTDAGTLTQARRYAEALAQHGAELRQSGQEQNDAAVVLPEKIGVISDTGLNEFDELFKQAAAKLNANLLIGVDHGTKTRRLNEARLFGPQGTLKAVYVKHHLVPRFEDVDQPGTERTVFTEASGVWGVQICKDMDFPFLSRQYGQQLTEILLVPAWDFVADDWLHDRMAVLRGVESGFPIARTAKQGLMTVSDDRGRILAQRGSKEAAFSYLLATVPVRHDATLYSRWGDWFAWLCIVLFVAALFVPASGAGEVESFVKRASVAALASP
jgi:apolipoprotein N-acyltransferase